MKFLTIIRGLPGSGKSTLASQLSDLNEVPYYEADQYFVNDDGEYVFDQSKLGQAHAQCLENAKAQLERDTLAIVSNTFTTIKELRPYFDLAKEHGIVPNVIVCQSNYGSVHDVPEEAIERMKSRFVYDLSPLFQSLQEVPDVI